MEKEGKSKTCAYDWDRKNEAGEHDMDRWDRERMARAQQAPYFSPTARNARISVNVHKQVCPGSDERGRDARVEGPPGAPPILSVVSCEDDSFLPCAKYAGLVQSFPRATETQTTAK